jgi:aromatic ring-opening dioxygenase LigB subunit
MPVVTGAILPHGSGVLPGFSEGGVNFKTITQAMEKAASIVQSADPEVAVLASPHNLRIRNRLGIVGTEHYSGSVSEGKMTVSVRKESDVQLAKMIYSEAIRKGIHAAFVNYGTDSGPTSDMPLDWGSVIPLYFLPEIPKMVLITPSRELPLDELVRLGEVVNKVSNKLDRRVAIIASADQAHTHRKDGPYGYDRAANVYDKRVEMLVKEGRLDKLLNFGKSLVSKAKPDSLWQMLILYGSLKGCGLRPVFVHYECPSYYGMLTAVFE